MQTRLEDQLNQLRLGGMKQALEQQQAQAGLYQDISFEERLQLLLSHELLQREQRKINRLEKQVQFRLQGQVEQIDYRSSRGFNKAQLRQLLEGHWLAHQQNLLLTGAAGCGKSYLACALGRYFIRQGLAVRYYRLKTLLEEMRLYGKVSTIVSSQLPVDKWYGMIGEATFAEAILDRLIHRAVRLNLTGESMRKQNANLIHADQAE